jgi:hypothetical protein
MGRTRSQGVARGFHAAGRLFQGARAPECNGGPGKAGHSTQRSMLDQFRRFRRTQGLGCTVSARRTASRAAHTQLGRGSEGARCVGLDTGHQAWLHPGIQAARTRAKTRCKRAVAVGAMHSPSKVTDTAWSTLQPGQPSSAAAAAAAEADLLEGPAWLSTALAAKLRVTVRRCDMPMSVVA